MTGIIIKKEVFGFLRLAGWVLLTCFVYLGIPHVGHTADAPHAELIILPFVTDPGISNEGMGSGLQYFMENLITFNTRIQESWFDWYIRDIFTHREDYRSFLNGKKDLSGDPIKGRNAGTVYILRGKIESRGNEWWVHLTMGENAHAPLSRKTCLPLDLPGCRKFKALFMIYMEQCGFAYSNVQRERLLYTENLSMACLSAIGKAYETYCSRFFNKNSAKLEIAVFDRAVRCCHESYPALTLKGWAEYRINATNSAIQWFSKAVKHRPDAREALNGLMWSYARLGQEKEAIRWGGNAALSRGESKAVGRADAFCAMAYQKVHEKDYQQAAEAYQNAMAQLASNADEEPIRKAKIHHHLGIVYFQMGQYAAAQQQLNMALTLRKMHLGIFHPQYMATLTMTARLYRVKGHYAKALECYQEILDIRRAGSDQMTPEIASAWSDLGRALQDLGRYEEAINDYQQALDMHLAIFGRNHLDTAESFHRLGTAFQMTCSYSRALGAFETALAIRLKILGRNHIQTASSYNDLGSVYERMGDGRKAMMQYQKSLSILLKEKGQNDSLTATVYHNMGIALQLSARYEEARAAHEKALAIRRNLKGENHPDTAMSHTALGCVKCALGDYHGAITDFRRSLDIRQKTLGEDHPLTASSYYNLGAALYFNGDYDAAFHHAGNALVLSEQVKVAELSWRVLDLLREVNEKKGRLQVAVVFGKSAVNRIQEMRSQVTDMTRSLQTTFVGNKRTVFENLARILIDLGRLSEAQEVLRMLKEEEYFDYISRDQQVSASLNQRAILSQTEDDWFLVYLEKIKHLADLDRRISALLSRSAHTRLTAAEQNSKRELQATYAAISEEVKDLVCRRTPGVSEAQHAVQSATSGPGAKSLQMRFGRFGPGTVMLSYLLTKAKLIMILTTPHMQIARETAVTSQRLNHLIYDYLKKVNSIWTDPTSAAKQLYDIILAPVAADLESAEAQTIIVSSSGPLRYLPMAALFDGDSYLVEKYAFVLLTAVMREPKTVSLSFPWKIAGLGTSEKVNPSFQALPAVKTELDRIIIENEQDHVGIYSGVVKLNSRFTRQALSEVIAAKYPVMHMATHFACNPGTLADSFLLMGDGSHLTLLEIQKGAYSFEGIDLVTLSACRTAIDSPDREGIEFESLGTLIQKKGAESVIASLWPVADQTTPVLMEKMYAFHKDKKDISKAEALRQAQCWFIKAYRPEVPESSGLKVVQEEPLYKRPYFWAPFILMEHL